MAFEISIQEFSFLENKAISEVNLLENEIHAKNFRQQFVCEYEGERTGNH